MQQSCRYNFWVKHLAYETLVSVKLEHGLGFLFIKKGGFCHSVGELQLVDKTNVYVE